MGETQDVVVVGGGLLGSAVGYGLARRGLSVTILDEGDTAFRAARGNFGLVWVQGKGSGYPPYANWTMRSAERWPELAGDLHEATGQNVHLSQPGGIHICLSEDEYEERQRTLETLASHQSGRFKYEMLGRNALTQYLPGLGPEVVGGSFTEYDGHTNPLLLLRALQDAFVRCGGKIRTGHRVDEISGARGDFVVRTEHETLSCARIVLAAGLGNKVLAPMVGLDQPVRPIKGQVLVTERTASFLDIPTTHVRQTNEGTVMIGDSHEDVGFDVSSSANVMKAIADRARRTFPALEELNIVRTWAALRVMTPDGFPVYDQSTSMPGAFAMSCHSGVTLAAAHALDFAGYVAEGALGEGVAELGSGRF